jgi:hypothetical protein
MILTDASLVTLENARGTSSSTRRSRKRGRLRKADGGGDGDQEGGKRKHGRDEEWKRGRKERRKGEEGDWDEEAGGNSIRMREKRRAGTDARFCTPENAVGSGFGSGTRSKGSARSKERQSSCVDPRTRGRTFEENETAGVPDPWKQVKAWRSTVR